RPGFILVEQMDCRRRSSCRRSETDYSPSKQIRFKAQVASVSRLCTSVVNMGRFFQKLDDHRETRLRQALDLNSSDHRPRSFRLLSLLRFPRDRAVVSFLVLPDRVFAGCMWSFGADFHVRPLSRIEIRDSVREFHRCLVEGGDDRRANQTLTNL